MARFGFSSTILSRFRIPPCWRRARNSYAGGHAPVASVKGVVGEGGWGSGGSGGVLDEVERGNLFVVALGGDPKWYRYHSLLAEYLQSHLKCIAPQSVPLLHRTASEWYRWQGRPVLAIEHALAGTDLDYALRLLSLHAEQLLADGRVRLLSRWLDAVPDTLLE